MAASLPDTEGNLGATSMDIREEQASLDAPLPSLSEIEGKLESMEISTSSDTVPVPATAVLQFKVILDETDPSVWRRIQVPNNYKFWGLHCAIQNSMGWGDQHLHRFRITNPTTGKHVSIGKPIEKGLEDAWSIDEYLCYGYKDMNDPNIKKFCESLTREGIDPEKALDLPLNMFSSWKVPLSKYYTSDDNSRSLKTEYTYDFGDRWDHSVVFEGSFPMEPGKRYPLCLEGERACPPEDAGGIDGYECIVDALRKPSRFWDDEQIEKVDWLWNHMKMPNYNPNEFDPKRVNFVPPKVWLAYKRSNLLSKKVPPGKPLDNTVFTDAMRLRRYTIPETRSTTSQP